MSIDYSKYTLILPMIGADTGTDFDDYSASGQWGVLPAVNGDAKISTAQSKFYGSSAHFDGASDFLDYESGSRFGFGTGDFSIGGWFYPTATTGNDRTLLDFRVSSNSPAAFYLDTSTAKLTVWTGTKIGNTGDAVLANAWQHIEFCRSSGTLYAFLNGALQWSAAFAADFGSARPLGIGGSINAGTPGGSPFAGYQNDLFAVKGVALHTSAFTPPGSLVKTISGAVLDDTGSAAANRKVVAVPRSYPVRCFTATTDVSGDYSVYVPDSECSRLVLDDDAGTLYNDIVDRVIPG